MEIHELGRAATSPMAGDNHQKEIAVDELMNWMIAKGLWCERSRVERMCSPAARPNVETGLLAQNNAASLYRTDGDDDDATSSSDDDDDDDDDVDEDEDET